MNAIVLDGNQRSALAVTRSLAKCGFDITVMAEAIPSLASCSKYCSQAVSYPSPFLDPGGFIQSVRAQTRKIPYSLLMPMSDVTVAETLRQKQTFDNAIIPFPEYEQYLAASNKSDLFLLARELNVPIPNTIFSTEKAKIQELLEGVGSFGYPVVLKPAFSRIRTGSGWIMTRVQYANGPRELLQLLDMHCFKHSPFIIQERITGSGIGIFLLMDCGKPLAWFAHKRIREKPPSGGVSVLCESTAPNTDAIKSAYRLLSSLKWSGVAMVEFKLDNRDSIPKLIEINARFWGSLELAISAGVDFPCLLSRFALGERINFSGNYRIGLRSRWELGDLDHLLLRLTRSDPELFLLEGAPSRLRLTHEYFADFFRPFVRNEIFKVNDPRPFLFEVKQYLQNILYCPSKV